ncbi:MAG: hypothetical protein M1819_001810 [Sarea resinae]|nr:MAG: hypothetical protein M1819_001810 [Sarea resinae]
MGGNLDNAYEKDAAPGAWPETPSQDTVPQINGRQPGQKRIAHGIDQATSSPYEEAFEKDDEDSLDRYEPIRAAETSRSASRPPFKQTASGLSSKDEDQLFKVLSKRRTNTSGRVGSTGDQLDTKEEHDEIERLMSRMFGTSRQEQSAEEKTRHLGVIFRNLTVTGMGIGAALAPTVGDVLLGLPRLFLSLATKGPRRTFAKPPVRTLLDNFTGCVRPGEMLLVLGRPGAGCSTFLKVLGNQRFGYESIQGDVTYGGTDAGTMMKQFRGEVLYNPEDDLHYATLSVKDTLTFALTCRTPGKSGRNEGESRTDYVREFLRVVAKLFWIEHTMGTKVGDAYVRGVSGGEKKRVSIAEAMITKASTQCWDNSTRGLDANTALEYVESLRALTNMAEISTSVALYQAGETLYNLFDKVMLIHEGKCCFFGRTEEARAYFEGLGYTAPDRWTTADFITSITDEHERQIKEGWEHRVPRSGAQLANAYKESSIYRANLADIKAFESGLEQQSRERESAQSKNTVKRNYAIPFHKQVLACTRRQFLVLVGDKQTLVSKWGGILFLALIVGSLFYNQPKTSAGVFPRGGVMFFMLLFNALLALAELTSAFGSRPILLKHKSFSFYRPAAFAIAQTVVDVPLVLVQVSIFNLVVYFMANLQRTASQFFISLLFLFITTMTMYSFFRSIGAICPSLDVATRITGVAIQALVVYTGYLIPPKSMHPWFSWLRWIDPVQYGFEALMSNEFYNLKIQCVSPDIVPIGPGVLAGHQSCLIQGSQPGQLIVNGADYIETAFSYTRAHLWRNFGIICAFFIFFMLLGALGMEMQKPNKGGGAVTIYKRGQTPNSVDQAIDGIRIPNDEETADKDSIVKAGGGEYSSSETDKDEAKGVARNTTVFTYQNVNYTIPVPGGQRKLLQDVQGYVRPGRLTALMGASGAGKTTLLNTLAQRINFGVVSGTFLVDGRPLPHSFQRATGFAEQQDVHEPTATVREALRFSAKLRQPAEVPLADKYEYCEKIIDLLEMSDIAGAIIGTIGSGLNLEQRKRVTIGVELASKPELLMFLDEPTSGLDSGAAFNIVRFLRKLANAGQAILCTIHQPSSVLFEHFDELLLLKSGGRVVYHGSLGKDSRELISYFERNGGRPCPRDANPAEYMLEVIGAGNPDYHGQDWADVWASSPEMADRTKEIQQMVKDRREVPASGSLKDDREYAMPVGTQIVTVVKRSFIAYWRTPPYMIGKVMLHIVTGLFNTFTFWMIGERRIDMQNRLFSIFMTLTIAPPLIQQLQPRFIQFRDIYESRESKSKIYSWVAFCIGAVLVELPYSIFAGSVYFNCWYWGVGFSRNSYNAGYTWMLLMLFEVYYVGLGQAIASFAPNEVLASILVPMFFIFVIAFCGVVVPFAALPTFWRRWMYWLSPFHWVVEGFLGVAVHGVPVKCASDEFSRFTPPSGQTCQQYTQGFIKSTGGYVQEVAGMCEFCQYANGDEFAASFNVYYRNAWRDYGIVFAYCIFNFMVVFACSWLYLQGGKRIKQALSRSLHRPKTRQQQSDGDGETG